MALGGESGISHPNGNFDLGFGKDIDPGRIENPAISRIWGKGNSLNEMRIMASGAQGLRGCGTARWTDVGRANAFGYLLWGGERSTENGRSWARMGGAVGDLRRG